MTTGLSEPVTIAKVPDHSGLPAPLLIDGTYVRIRVCRACSRR